MKAAKSLAIAGEPVDKALVHKYKVENVLVGNLRRPLPCTLPVDTVQKEVFKKFNESQKAVFEKFYKVLPENEQVYSLETIKTPIPLSEIRDGIAKKHIPRSDIRYFLKHFKRNKRTDEYYLADPPDEPSIIRLARILDDKKKLMSDREKAILSDAFENTQVDIPGNIFYANMLVDTSHSYYFEHPNEHVPGMMVVEAIRQMLVACSHKYGKVPLSGYNFILSTININFKSYLELNYPILFKVKQTECHTYDTGVWADVAFQVSAYQKEVETTVQTFSGNIITSRVFKRLRSSKEQINIKHWFILKTNIEYEIILRSARMSKIKAQIEYISHTEMIVIVESKLEDSSLKSVSQLEYFMYFSKVGFIHGLATLKSINHFGDFSQIHLVFSDMDKVDRDNLTEVIKRYGYLLED